jgi:hypothetical protein
LTGPERRTVVDTAVAKGRARVREYIDAETNLPIKITLKVDVPQLGRDLEQTTEFSDYREVHGVKVPFRLKITRRSRTTPSGSRRVEHNVTVDEKLFSSLPRRDRPMQRLTGDQASPNVVD